MTRVAASGRDRLIRTVAVTGIILLCTAAVLVAKDMLLSFVLGFVISYMFSPVVNAIERTGVSRKTGVTWLFLLAGSLLTLCVYKLLPEISSQLLSLKHEFPKYSRGISGLVSSFEESLNRVFPDVYKVDLGKSVETLMVSAASSVFNGLPGFVSTFLSVAVMAPLLAFFMLIDGKIAVKKLLEIVPNNLFELALNLVHQINTQIGGFVRARLIESLIVGGVVWLGLFMIDMPYSIFFAVFAGLTNLIPYIGPVIGAIPPVLVAIVNGATGVKILMVVGVFGISQLIDNVLIVPMVVAKIVDLHAVTVLIVIIIGAQVGGVLGMIISIPVTSIVKLILTTVYQHLTDSATRL